MELAGPGGTWPGVELRTMNEQEAAQLRDDINEATEVRKKYGRRPR